MPVYLLTFHAYRTWRPDHPKGYVRRDAGILPPDPEKADQYDQAASQPPVTFDDAHQQVLIAGALDVASRRAWRVHAIATAPTHMHILVSWNGDAHDWKHVHDTFKRLLGMMLSQRLSVAGRKWFARKGSRKRVCDRDHLDYLMTRYLPRHAGRTWFEDAVSHD